MHASVAPWLGRNLESSLMSILKYLVGWRQRRHDAFAFGVFRRHFRLRGLALALFTQLVIVSAARDLAQADEQPPAKILSACRVPPREAYGDIRKVSPETKKGYKFILAATPFKFTGAYERAIE